MKTKKVLFVCSGNTCRSPMAERILKQKLKDKNIKNIRVSSAGLYAEEGQPMTVEAAQALKHYKVRASAHKSKLLTKEMLSEYDLIIAMTTAHKSALSTYSNVVSLADYIKGIDVLDPFGQNIEVYKKVCQYLMYAADEIVEKLTK